MITTPFPRLDKRRTRRYRLRSKARRMLRSLKLLQPSLDSLLPIWTIHAEWRF